MNESEAVMTRTVDDVIAALQDAIKEGAGELAVSALAEIIRLRALCACGRTTEADCREVRSRAELDEDRADTLSAAIEFVIEQGPEGIAWLSAWNDGDPDAMADLEIHRGAATEEETP